MGERIGLDLGTATTLMSKIDEDGKFVDILPEEGDSPYRASLALKKKDGSWVYGQAAKTGSGQKFSDFKMLLKEDNQKLLTEFGYNAEDTPEKVMAGYLNSIIAEDYLKHKSTSNRIEKLVVGVPEVWLDEKEHGQIARLEFARILKDEIQCVDHFEMRGEPVLACAYYVHKLRQVKNNKPFEGDVIIVDYGGGTLDITVCEVTSNKGKNEITPRLRTGAGQNAERNSGDFDVVGKAGHAFLREIVNKVLKDRSATSNTYTRLMYQLEDQLKSAQNMQTLETVFKVLKDLSYDDPLWDEMFTELDITDDEQCEITYRMIEDAYSGVIRKTLDSKLEKVKEKYFEPKGINVKDSSQMDLKIVKVGGFCKFWLTRQQINDYFGFVEVRDERDGDSIIDSNNIDKAVSYGAALIANDVIKLNQTTPFYVGVGMYDVDVDRSLLPTLITGKDSERWLHFSKELEKYKDKENPRDEIAKHSTFFAIPKDIVIKPNEPLYIQLKSNTSKRDKYGIPLMDKPKKFISTQSIIPYLAVCWGESPEEEPDTIKVFEPPEEFKEAFSVKNDVIYNIGFSLDESMVITLHLRNTRDNTEEKFRLKELRKIVNEGTSGFTGLGE